jgi:hypothetical protein
MSEMVDRIASAIVDAGYNPATARPIAKIAIAAMREPTNRMLDSGADQLECDGEKECWQAMIDEALK